MIIVDTAVTGRIIRGGCLKIMENIDVRKKKRAEVEVKGRMALFMEPRVIHSAVPEGMYCYALWHGEDFGLPCTIEKSVKVDDYFGTVIMVDTLALGDTDYMFVGNDDFIMKL